MTVFFQSWKESFSLFFHKNAKRFFWITVKTILQSYKYIFKHIWWLFLLSCILDSIYTRYYGPASWFLLIPLFSWLVTIFFMYLIIRPSIKRKSFDYYKQYSLQLIYFIVLTILFSALFATVLMQCTGFKAFLLMHTLILFPFGPIFTAPLLSFMILFMLDSNGTILSFFKSIIRAIKMTLYNYPFCFIMLLLFTLLAYLYQMVIFYMGQNSIVSSSIISHALLPIPLSIWTNFYTKRIHDQFELYYPQTIKE